MSDMRVAMSVAEVEALVTSERLLALLKLIAETPEPRDTIQVWAWQAYKREVPDA